MENFNLINWEPLKFLFPVSLGILFSVYVTQFSYLDEGITLLAVILCCMVIASKLVISYSQIMISLLVLFSIFTLHISVYKVTVVDVYLGAFLIFKFFAILFIVSHLFQNKKFALIFAYVALVISLLGLAINLAIPSVYNNFFELREIYRDGSLRYAGAFLNPNLSGIVLSGSAAICANLSRNLYKYRLVILIFMLLIASFIFVSRTTQIFIMFLIILPYIASRNKLRNYVPILVALMCFLLFSFYLAPSSQTTTSNLNMLNQSQEANVRVLILTSGIRLAIENFPYGAGFGTFASKADVGMKLFQDLGIDQHYAIKQQRGLHDSSVAVILGQLGVIGLVMYLYIVKLLLSKQAEFKNCANTVMVFFFILGLVTPFFFSAIMAMVVILSIKITLQTRDYDTRK